jgi:hypothetical protein
MDVLRPAVFDHSLVILKERATEASYGGNSTFHKSRAGRPAINRSDNLRLRRRMAQNNPALALSRGKASLYVP